MASPDQNKELIYQYFEAYDRQDTERIGQLVSSSNYTLHLSGMPPMDWNGTKQFYAAAWSAFPDLHHEILDIVAEGDKVAVRYNIIGTHKGELEGIPATGKEVSFGAMDFITLIDGKVAEEWEIADTMGLLQQIGAIPANAHAATSSKIVGVQCSFTPNIMNKISNLREIDRYSNRYSSRLEK